MLAKERLMGEIAIVKTEMMGNCDSRQNLKYMHYMILGMINLAYQLKIIDRDERLELKQQNREHLNLLLEVAA